MAYGRGQANPVWRTPLTCNGGACIKVAASGQAILIADSKQPEGPILSYSHDEWQQFVAGIKNGDFDDLVP
jgi:predicted secreted Zn-dependent protease